MSKWDRTNIPCPCGKSSDAYSIDVSGNGFCFSGGCGKFFKNNKEVSKNKNENEFVQMVERTIKINNEEHLLEFQHFPHRGISRKTMEFYNVKTKFLDGEPVECAFVMPNKAMQIKNIQEDFDGKRYRVENSPNGSYGENGLFGLNLFDAGSKDSITICEGYHDALAVYEMTGGNTAAVSIKSSSTAKNDCVKDWEKINSFKKIYLCLDNDEAGREALREIAPLFDFNKVYRVNIEKYKDANDYLIRQETKEFLSSWKNARRFAPDNIISTFSEIEKALKEDREAKLGDYPFRVLNQQLYGLHEGEVVVVKAPEGVGKTAFFRALEYHILVSSKHNIGVIHLEEDNGTTVKAIAGHHLKMPAVLPDCGLSEEDILTGFKSAVQDTEGRVHIYSSFDVESEDNFLNNLRFLISAAGCRFIFLDHISWLATGMEDEDERKKLDRLSQKIKLLAKELRACIIMISHVNDDGKTRGSRNISKVANTVISLHRDIISMDPMTRNTTEFLIEKARLGGRTGPGGKGYYNTMTGILEEYIPEDRR